MGRLEIAFGNRTLRFRTANPITQKIRKFNTYAKCFVRYAHMLNRCTYQSLEGALGRQDALHRELRW